MSKWPGDPQSEKTTFGDLRRGELTGAHKKQGESDYREAARAIAERVRN